MNYVNTLSLQKIGHKCGNEGSGKRVTGRGKKYHIDTYTHPAVLQR